MADDRFRLGFAVAKLFFVDLARAERSAGGLLAHSPGRKDTSAILSSELNM